MKLKTKSLMAYMDRMYKDSSAVEIAEVMVEACRAFAHPAGRGAMVILSSEILCLAKILNKKVESKKWNERKNMLRASENKMSWEQWLGRLTVEK